MCRPSRLIQEGRSCVVTVASRACGGRGSVGTKGAGRAGSPCEPETACGRAALSSSSRQHASGNVDKAGRSCGGQRTRVRQNRVVLAVVATVKPFEGASEPDRADCIIQFEWRGRPERTRLPGDHGISRPTIAQGRPSVRHHLYAAVRFFCVCLSRSRPRVRAGTRPSLRPLGFRGWSDQAKLGRNAPREREGVSANRNERS